MACFHPLKAKQDLATKQVFFGNQSRNYRDITLPCGSCVGCRLKRSKEWAIRCIHEAKMHDRNSFITLTYDDNKLPYRPFGVPPANKSLYYPDFQLFMKRLRKAANVPVRFYMAGEYGENFGRSHFHACIFGYDFSDKKPFKKTPSGSIIYTSSQLEKLWPYGFSSVGNVDFQSAAYVARYIMKKITGNDAYLHYSLDEYDPLTGEICSKIPEFNKMSLKPGIGAVWLDKYNTDVYPHDSVIVKGREMRPPRYYDKLLARAVLEPDKSRFEVTPAILNEYDLMLQARLDKAKLQLDDNTPDRLKAKEQVAIANLQKLKRKLI